jgi:hypothetical protein
MATTYANNVRCAIDSNGLDSSATSFGVTTPSAPFNLPPNPTTLGRLTLVDNLYAPTKLEIITYTSRSGNTISGVTRGQEGTTAQAFLAGYVYQAATAADYSAFSAAASITPIGVLGTGSDTSFDTTDSLVITHSTLSSASRFKRVGAVYEYTAGASSTDSTMDFDYADITSYTRDVETPNATITPSAVSNTYQDYTFGTGTTIGYSVGRVTSTQYQNTWQMFKGPCIATGFSIYLNANTNTPTGNIAYKILKIPAGSLRYVHWASCQVIFSGSFTPVASSTNTVSFGSSVYLDDSFYVLIFYSESAQDGDSDLWTIAYQNTTLSNARGAYSQYAPASGSIDGPPGQFSTTSQQFVITLTNGKINSGVTLTISGDYWYPSDIGKTVRGNSGHFLITGLTDLCTGGTALSGAGTAANAFDNDLIGTSCSAGTDGYVGYDFGSSKTIRGVAVMFADASYDRILDLLIEVSDDNFSSSTTVVNPTARVYQNRVWYYWDISSPTAGRYIRIRETGGAELTVGEMECFDGTTALAHLHLSAFANTNAIASGNWTLEGTGWNNGWASGEVSSGVIYPLTTVGTSTIDGIASSLVYGGPQFVNRATNSSEALINTTWPSLGAKIYHLGSNMFAMIYTANSNADAYAVIVTVASDGSITFGTPSAFILGGAYDSLLSDIVALSSTLFVIAHKQTLWACSVSGTAIAVGTGLANTANTLTTGTPSLTAIDSTRFVCVGSLATTSYVTSVAGSVSGTTITLGSKVDLTAAAGDTYAACVKVSTDKVLAAYILAASGTTIRGKILSLTGTSISAGSEATGTLVQGYLNSKTIAALGTDKALIVAPSTSSTTVKSQAIVASVSGTTITFGTAVNIAFIGGSSTVGGGVPKIICASSGAACVGNKSYLAPLSISGTTITVRTLQPSLGGWADANGWAIGSSFAVLAQNGYVAANRATVNTAKLTAQSNLLIGPSMSVSFDGETYKVWNGSAARNIASSDTAVHGGTDGVWYYRDSASVWTAASSSTAIQALKQAQAYSANCMSIDEMKDMTTANWTTFGFVEAAATTYFAFTWQSDTTRYLNPYDLDKFSLTYTSRDRWDQLNANYVFNMGVEDRVTITKSAAGTKSIKAVIMGPSS